MALGIGELIKPVQGALAPVGGTLTELWQGVVGDRVAAWRLKNAVKIQSDIHEELKKAGLALNTSKIPERYAFAWFDEATKQDEPKIQVLFARLLVRAANGDADAMDRRHIGLLGQFTPSDAKTFAAIFDPSKRQRIAEGVIAGPPSWDEQSLLHILESEEGTCAIASVEHLLNIGILNRTYHLQESPFSRIRRTVDLGTGPAFSASAANDLKIETRLAATALGMSLQAALG